MSEPAKLEIARNTIDRGDRRLDVLAPITKRASGQVHVELHAAGKRYRFDADVNSAEGYVRFRKRIPGVQARLGTGIVTIAYSGNERTRGQEVRLRAASGRAQLDAQRPELAVTDGQLRLHSKGKLSERARGVVRVQLDWVDASGADRSYETNAKIDDGAWRLSETLPDEVRKSIVGRRSTVHSYTLFTGYLRARMRGEMKAYQVLPRPAVEVPSVGSPAAPAPAASPASEGSDSDTTPPPASPDPPGSTLGPAKTLAPGETLVSPNKQYRLVMQADDGNLVMYSGSTAVWKTGATGAGSRAVMQDDGNLVVYNGSAAKWLSHTTGFAGALLTLQDDGNLVIYHSGRAIWTRGSGYIGHTLSPGATLGPGDYLKSANKQYRLVMQPDDGNLVLYKGATAVWQTGRTGAGSRAVMQGDGNLVVYSGAEAKWLSNTTGFAGALLSLQDDGNLVIYHSGRAIWTRGSGYIGHTLSPGATLGPGDYLKSANKQYRLVMQADDGNLVLIGPSGALWNTGTAGNPGARAVMQDDGNLVVYSSSSRALWNTQTTTSAPSGYRLVVQDDQNIVIYQGFEAKWSRFGLAGDGFSFPLGDGRSADNPPITQGYCQNLGRGPHLGVDWGAGQGTPVYAAARGTVTRASTSDSYGHMIMLRHDLPDGSSWYTLYAHLRDPPGFSAGQAISRRQLIGAVGNTGDSEGPHLHFAVTRESAIPRGYGTPCPGASGTVDPVAFIQARLAQ